MYQSGTPETYTMPDTLITRRTKSDRILFWMVNVGVILSVNSAIWNRNWAALFWIAMFTLSFWLTRGNELVEHTRQINRVSLAVSPRWNISFGDAPKGKITIGSPDQLCGDGPDEYVSVTSEVERDETRPRGHRSPWPSRSNPQDN
jgi:hypothetical protein